MKDGGPAFPVPWPLANLDGYDRAVPGMSLRDWFAGMALAAKPNILAATSEVSAAWAYATADAMLKEREK